MEWREQSSVSCDQAYWEAQRWVEAATDKNFGSKDFRSALENGILLCDLINKIKPGVIKRVNRLSTPIAGLDNLNIFLKACGKLGLKEAQLFHPGDLQDLSTRVTVKRQETNRRLKNVLITIYWLGRRAHCDPFYDGPYLNLKAFEGLLGTALSKALEESSSPRGGSVRDSGFGDGWYSDREEAFHLRGGGGERGRHQKEDSLDSLDSLSSRPHSISSDATLKGSSEGWCSDAEADSIFRMADNKDSLSYRRSLVITPKTTAQFNQFLPTKDKASGYVPAPLRRKKAERHEDNRRSWASPMYTEEDGTFTSETGFSSPDSHGDSQASQGGLPAAQLQWAYEYESGSDSDADRPDPDLVLDDLASRRFHSASPAPPTNFAVPISPLVGPEGARGSRSPWPAVQIIPNAHPPQNEAVLSSSGGGSSSYVGAVQPPPQLASVRVEQPWSPPPGSLFSEPYDDSEDEDDEVGYADPVQDDLYARKVGLAAQTAGNVPYDKFLPKFWTPEEDVHIQKIKLGSQRRPWYKKMQGFSHKKSGYSSDDSDCDASPWFSSAPSLSGPSPSHSHTPDASVHTTRVVGKSLHIQPHTTPQLPPTYGPYPESSPLVFAKMDPTSGPKLVKCERRPLFGRQDPREPPDPVDYDNILPDLENDDMFSRRTLAFQSNGDLVLMKTRFRARRPGRYLYASEPELNIVIRPESRSDGGDEESRYPDIEQDDVIYRNLQQARQCRPLSGAPDNYTPMPIPEPWALPPDLQARLLCPPCPLSQEAKADKQHQDGTGGAHPRTDDMLVRKLESCQGQGSARGPSAKHMAPSVPASRSEGDLHKWQAIREASQLRHKKRLMVEKLATMKLLPQKPDGSDGSKSMNNIQVDPAVTRQVRYEELQKIRENTKDSDDKWQDDLTKWKNRRRSVNSDIVKKKEEREQIEHITYGGSSRKTKTLKEMQEGRETRDRSSIGSRLSSLSYLDEDQDVFDNPVPSPRARSFPARSYTIDTPYSSEDPFPAPSSVPSLREEEYRPHSPAVAASVDDRVDPPPTTQEVDPADRNTSSSSVAITTASTSLHSTVRSPSPPAAVAPMERNWSQAREEPSVTAAPSSFQKAPEPWRPSAATQAAPSSASLYKQPQHNSLEAKTPGVSRVSASLPRSYQRSDSARLTSVIAPRPFGTQSTLVSSLPRSVTLDDAHKRVNGNADLSKKSSVPSRYQQFITSEDEARSHSSSARSSEDEENAEEKGVASDRSASPIPPPVKSEAPASPAPVKDTSQDNYCDMRINVNQRPNSDRDFGFQASWDSSGAHVKSIQPGSPAEVCQLQVGDEVLTVSGHRVADMSHADWKRSMEDALQQGSLVMDVRRHGKNNWERDLPSPPFKSHKTINLTTTDHPILLGVPDARTANTSLDFTSLKSMETATPDKAPTHPVINMASNGLNGGLREEMVTIRNKESEPISLKNLKRRSEFFEQGGSESAISDIPVPPLTLSSNRWSWDLDEERRRQEKWQKEQERLLQEKYKRDQEKLEEEWRKAQQELNNTTTPQPQEVAALPLSPRGQPTPPWEAQLQEQEEVEEERRRKEEQERQRQAEERRRREEDERELRRLQEERERRERLQAEERKRWEEEEQRRKKREEEELRRKKREEEELRRKREEEEEEEAAEAAAAAVAAAAAAAERQQREREQLLEQQRQQQWDAEHSGFANVQSILSYTDRAKSKSTPELDEVEKPGRKDVLGPPGGMAHCLLEEQLRCRQDKGAQSQRTASELELERRNILNAMRYRDPERAEGIGGAEASWRKGHQQQPAASQAELERQQILREMKKKTQLLTDSSWIRQRSATGAGGSKEPVDLPMRRGESLDHLDAPRSNSSWRSSWTPGSMSSIPNYSRPHSMFSGPGARPGSATLPSSSSADFLRGGAGPPSAPWGRRSPSVSPSPSLSPSSSLSPAVSPEPSSEPRPPQQRSRSVSGRKICTFCDSPLGKGAAMIIESLGLCFHLGCFKCIDCGSDLGGSEVGAEVRIRNKQLYCNTCYMRFKTGQPTSM